VTGFPDDNITVNVRPLELALMGPIRLSRQLQCYEKFYIAYLFSPRIFFLSEGSSFAERKIW